MRNWATLINEIIVPIILILFGLGITKIPTYFDGPVRWLTPSDYELPQSVIVNSNGIAGSYTVDDLIQYFDPGAVPLKYALPSGSNKQNLKAMDEFAFASRGVDPYRYGSLYIKTLDPQAKLYEFVVFVNISSQDSSGVYVGQFSQAVLRLATGNPKLNLTFANAPLPLTFEARSHENAKNGGIISNALVVAFALLPASLVSFIVREREDNLKHQQLITGVSLVAYWVSNAAMDVFKSLIPCSISIGLIYAFEIDLPFAWLLIILYAFTIIPFTYATSFLFVNENLAQVTTLMFHFFAGVVLSPVFTILHLFENTRVAGRVLGWIFRVIPSFSLSYGISNISYKQMYAILEGTSVKDDLDFEIAGGDVLFLCLFFAIYIMIIAMIEAQWFDFLLNCCEPKKEDRSDTHTVKHELVLREEKQSDLLSNAKDPPAVLARHLRKLYRISPTESVVAVNDLSFYTKRGECIALLGTNGAGKTTTFKMITRDVLASRGEIYINGKELCSNFTTIRKSIGYGPQYESSYMSMTTRENLEFYAKIKGIPAELQEPIIAKLMHEMRLEEYEFVLAGQLSGGNKRKLTVAIALLGNPPIVLLDEPSTGVDPQAKRFMWHIIQRICTKNKNTAVILTTHSMEEAEYLCTKMAIMIGGDFSCIGTPQELKDAFGKGFEIQISVPLPSEKEESEYLSSFNLGLNTEMDERQILNLFNSIGRPELSAQLAPKGNASHIAGELLAGKKVKAKIVANFLLIERHALNFALEIAEEFGEVKVPESIGNFFKFRIDKSKPHHTIGFLFGLVQELVQKYGISQYSASQTSLNQIFQTLAKQAEVFILFLFLFNHKFSMDSKSEKMQ